MVETEGVRAEAVDLVLNTAKTGRIYTRNTVKHQASAPGESFASDTGNAINHIQTRFEDDHLTGIINSGAEYAAALEFGTEKMEPRPVMRPALANKAKSIERNIGKAVARGVKKSA